MEQEEEIVINDIEEATREQKIILLGDYLQTNFKDWFLFFFKNVNNINFIIDDIHEDLFNCFIDLFDLKTIRQIINMPPRSAKSVMASYFMVFCLVNNPKANFIYLSYSQKNINDTSEILKSIFENETFKQMYYRVIYEEEDTEYIDDYWYNNYREERKKFKMTNKIIRTAKGGTIYLTTMGSQVLGSGAGQRIDVKDKKFTGGIIIDDPQDSNKIIYERYIENTNRYFTKTILNRLNNAWAFILLIQQRLSNLDMSAFLEENYKFNILRKPLLNEKGECQIKSQYTPERIEELKRDNESFMSLFQQTPTEDLSNKPFNDVKISNDIIEKGGWIGWFDPAGSGKDYSSLAIVQQYGVFLKCYGWMWRKDWRFCVDYIEDIDALFDIKKLITETNFTDEIIINQLIKLGIETHGYKTTQNKIKKILACSIFSQNIVLEKTTYEEKANIDFINNVKNWNKRAEHDDGIDALSSYLWFSGLVK